jgi:hypothetical protein
VTFTMQIIATALPAIFGFASLAYATVAFARGLDLNSSTMLCDRAPELIAFALFVVT